MENATVEIVIPVHNTQRPIERAVASVLSSSRDDVQVSVVCHNLESGLIAARLTDYLDDPRLALSELLNSEPLAAAPRNFAIARSSAKYIGFLDSDDEFEAGALDAWCNELVGAPDLLIGQFSSDSAGRIHAPAPRPQRFDRLDPVRDLLNYRTAPLGVLVRRELLRVSQSPGYRSGMQTGEDIALGLYLWNHAKTISYSKHSSGYHIHEDGVDRVTGSELQPEQQLAAVREAVTLPVISRLSKRRRQAIAVKLIRTQLFGYLLSRSVVSPVDRNYIDAAATTLEEVCSFAPGVLGFLDVGEMSLVRAIQRRNAEEFFWAAHEIDSIPSYRKVITRNPFRTLAAESPLGRERRSNALAAYFSN